MDISTIGNLLLFILLIILTMLFVGSEFAFVKARMSKIHALVEMGDKRAVRVEKMINNLDYYLSACQLGITVTALGLGWIGESTFEVILHPLFNLIGVPESMSAVATVAAAFIIVTFIHVVVGELAPKTVAIQYAEKMALSLSGPLYFFGVILKPFIWTMNGAARGLVRLVGIKEMPTEQAHSEEELKVIMTESYRSGEINQTELAYMQNIFSFDERTAKDVMVPRTQMITLEEPVTVDQVIETIKEYNYTRYPVTESNGDKDNIGFINVREYLTNHVSDEHVAAGDYIHELPVITESSRISDALVKMQRERVHIALIIDEYGGTAGMVTMEDILEEIVGEIRDEFDENEEVDITQVDENIYHISGRVLLDDLEDDFKIAFNESEDIDTIGGWMQSINTDIVEGEYIDTEFDRWQVLEIENHSIKQVAFLRDYNKVSDETTLEEDVESNEEK